MIVLLDYTPNSTGELQGMCCCPVASVRQYTRPQLMIVLLDYTPNSTDLNVCEQVFFKVDVVVEQEKEDDDVNEKDEELEDLKAG